MWNQWSGGAKRGLRAIYGGSGGEDEKFSGTGKVGEVPGVGVLLGLARFLQVVQK